MRLLLAWGLLVALTGAAGAETPRAGAWPTRGGEGGRVIEVNSLADSGPGTLREAVAQEGRRMVRFTVAGEIWLNDVLIVANPGITIDGESAPSPGITLMGDKIRIQSSDVVLRHLRIRVGALAGGSNPENRDAISIEAKGGEPSARILVDHCSISWAIDEGVQLWGKGGRDIAVTNSIVAESLDDSIHPKGKHSMGLLVGPGFENVLVGGNLFAHNAARNPVIAGGSSAVVVNNLIYNPAFAALHFYRRPDEPPSRVSAVGNVVVAGPDTKSRLFAFSQGVNPGSQVFYRDNASTGTATFLPGEKEGRTANPISPLVDEPPVWLDGVEPLPAGEVEKAVLAGAGARPWDRDAVDKRIVAEVAARRGAIRDEPSDPRLGRDAPADHKTKSR